MVGGRTLRKFNPDRLTTWPSCCYSFTSISLSFILHPHTINAIQSLILHNHNRHKERKIPDAILKHLCGVNERVRHKTKEKVNGYKENEKAFFYIFFSSPAIVECGGSYLQPLWVYKCGWFSKKKESKFMYRIQLTLEEFYCCCHAPHSGTQKISSSYFISQG